MNTGFFAGDFHNDVLTEHFCLEQAVRFFEETLDGCQAAEICLAVWGTEYGGFPEQAVADFFALRARLSPRIDVRLCFEDLWYADENSLARIAELHPLYCSLTWNNANALAGGALSDGRLTPYGREVVRFLQQREIAVDTAHLNRASFYDVLDITQAPLVNSHTCLDRIVEHPRNVTDDQVRQIVAGGGLVGLTMVGDFLAPDGHARLEDYVDQLDAYAQRFGTRTLAIGTDFFGTRNLPDTVKNYKTYPVLLEKLLQMGYNGEVIRGVLYENLHRFTERRKEE